MPQLNPEFFVSQLFWLTVSFTFLFLFLWRISLPRIGSVLEKRHSKINEDLTKAKELQIKAQEVEQNINSQISEAKKITNEKIKMALSKLDEKSSNQLKTLDLELEEKIMSAEKKIKENKDNQLKQINEELISITKVTTSRVGNLEVSDVDVLNALKNIYGDIK